MAAFEPGAHCVGVHCVGVHATVLEQHDSSVKVASAGKLQEVANVGRDEDASLA